MPRVRAPLRHQARERVPAPAPRATRWLLWLLTGVHAPRGLSPLQRGHSEHAARGGRGGYQVSAARAALRLTRVTVQCEPGCGPACNSRASWCPGTPPGSCTTRTRASCASQTAVAPRPARSWEAPVNRQRRASATRSCAVQRRRAGRRPSAESTVRACPATPRRA